MADNPTMKLMTRDIIGQVGAILAAMSERYVNTCNRVGRELDNPYMVDVLIVPFAFAPGGADLQVCCAASAKVTASMLETILGQLLQTVSEEAAMPPGATHGGDSRTH